MNANQQASWERLTEFVTQTMQETRVPGVALGVWHAGETMTAGFGVTNVDHPLPVTDETLFQIGSITKTFTGTAIMRLVEMDKLRLDAPVRSYLPDFKLRDEATAAQVTLRHLLTHMGGWEGDYFDDTGAGDDALARYMAGMANLEQIAPLGEVWSYNNAGFCLAGYLVEKVTGQSYRAALNELVLQPLGLKNACLEAGEVLTYRFAVGHSVAPQGPLVARPWPLPRSVHPAGGLICHVKDLLRYARFHLGDGGVEDGDRLLTAESMAQMQSPQVTVWGQEMWGLPWSLDETAGVRQVLHGGGTLGQAALLVLAPAHNFALVILTNADQGGLLNREVSRQALKEYLELETPLPAPIEASKEELAAYVGRYSRPFTDIELGILGGRLVGQITYKGGFPTQDSPAPPPPPPMPLALCEPDRLLVLDGDYKDARFDVVRRSDGSIVWLRAQGRIHRREAS